MPSDGTVRSSSSRCGKTGPMRPKRFAAKRRMKYEVLRGADLFLAMTPRSACCLEMEGADPKKIRVLPPGIDTERFRPRPKPEDWLRKLGLQPDDFVFVSVAALRWEKGVFDILHAFKRMTLAAPARSLKLVFAGVRAGRKAPARAGRTDRPGGSCDLHSLSLRRDAPAVQSCRCLHAGFHGGARGWLEQFGYVLAEALASGTPIVTTQHGLHSGSRG